MPVIIFMAIILLGFISFFSESGDDREKDSIP
jgi:hypothetical protein